MKLNKEKFLKTELGGELQDCIISWDQALEAQRKYKYYTEEYKAEGKRAYWCQAQWEVYQMAIKQFFGVQYCFTRTDNYYGLVTEDGADWLFKVCRA